MNPSAPLVLLLTLFALGAAPRLPAQSTWFVQGNGTPAGTGSESDPFGSIQQAIDFASGGDLIRVRYGNYAENVDFHGKAVHVRGEGLFLPYLVPQAGGPGVLFANGEGPSSRLESLRILATGAPVPARGVVCRGSSPVLDKVILLGGRAPTGPDSYGGNLLLEAGAAPVLIECEVVMGVADLAGGSIAVRDGSRLIGMHSTFQLGAAPNGGILHIAPGSSAMLRNCRVLDGLSDAGAVFVQGGRLVAEDCRFEGSDSTTGGGALALVDAHAEFLHCDFLGNEVGNGQAPVHGEGGMLHSTDSQVRFEDCEIRRNAADLRGGAVHARGGLVEFRRCLLRENETATEACAISAVDCDLVVADSIVINNRVLPGNNFPGDDGALVVRGGSLALTRSTVASTFTWHAGGGGLLAEGSTVDVHGSILWLNFPGAWAADAAATVTFSYSDVEGGAPGTGNIDQDPLFLSILDGHLQPGSPCLDRVPRVRPIPLDFERDPREFGSALDMGGDEWAGDARLRSYGSFRSYGFGELGVHFRGNFYNVLAISPALLPTPVPLPQGDWLLASPVVLVPFGGSPNGEGLLGIQVPPIPARTVVYAQVFNFATVTNVLAIEVGGP